MLLFIFSFYPCPVPNRQDIASVQSIRLVDQKDDFWWSTMSKIRTFFYEMVIILEGSSYANCLSICTNLRKMGNPFFLV